MDKRDTANGLELIPESLRKKFEVHQWRHATAILKHDFPSEWEDLLDLLHDFRLCKSHITKPGGAKSDVASTIDTFLSKRGWVEREFRTVISVDEQQRESPTHKVDCFKNRVALEIEWNNKDPFFDRDLNNFRLLFDLHVISVGIIITRCDGLQSIFNRLDRGKSYGASTTHMSKLLPRINGGGGGGCPILLFGISEKAYSEEC
jgi:hypothetical protein